MRERRRTADDVMNGERPWNTAELLRVRSKDLSEIAARTSNERLQNAAQAELTRRMLRSMAWSTWVAVAVVVVAAATLWVAWLQLENAR